eukprot:403376449
MISKREIEQLQKEILYPTYFDKYHNVKIKDLTVNEKYNQILQIALKTQNNQKKIKSLTKAIEMQKSLQKLLRHGFNATNIEVDDVHLMRRMQDNEQEMKIKGFLQKFPSSNIDSLLRDIYGKNYLLSRDNVIKTFGPTQRQIEENEREEEQKLKEVEITEVMPNSVNPVQNIMNPRSVLQLRRSSVQTVNYTPFNPQRRSVSSQNLNIKYLSQNQQVKFMQLEQQLSEVKEAKNLDQYSMANQNSKKSVCSYKSVKRLNVLQSFEQNAYKRKINKLDTIYKRGEFLKQKQQKDEEEELEKQRKELEEQKRELEQKAAEAKAIQKRTFLQTVKKPQLLKELSNHDYVLKRVQQKLYKSKTNSKSMNDIIEDIVRKENQNMKKQTKEESKEFQQKYASIIEKLDFSKRFFEPIIEERDIDKHQSKGQKLPRHLKQMNITHSPGIVPGIDKEHAVSPSFQNKQQEFFDNRMFRRSEVDFFQTQIQEMEREQSQKRNSDSKDQPVSPKKTSPYIMPFKQLFKDIKLESRVISLFKPQQSFEQQSQVETITQYTSNSTYLSKVQSQQQNKRKNDTKTSNFRNTQSTGHLFSSINDKQLRSGSMFRTSSNFTKPKYPLEEITKEKVKDLTGIIWDCSNLIDQNQGERKTLRQVEQYTHQEFRELHDKYDAINGVNDMLQEL